MCISQLRITNQQPWNKQLVLNEHFLLLVGRFVPTKIICVRNKDKPWFDDQCRHAFGLKQEAHLRWTPDRSQVNWEEFVCCEERANETYLNAKCQFSARNREVLMNDKSPHKWLSTLKSAVFGLSSSMPPLVGGMVCESVGKADLSDHFDGKQSRESVDLPLTCHPSPSLTSFASRSSEVRRLLFDLEPNEGSDPLDMLHLFLKRTANVLAPCLSVVFRRIVLLGSFPACWRQANITPIPNGPPSCCLLPHTDRFPYHLYCLRCLSSWCRFASDDLWNSVVLWNVVLCFQPPCLLIGKEWVHMTHFCHVPFTEKCIGEWAEG